MTAYSDFFLNSRADVIQYELLEITHPAFTQRFRFVRNARDGVIVTLPADGAESYEPGAEFTYFPARIRQPGAQANLEAAITVSLGDLGQVLPLELDAVAAAGAFLIKPKVRYWVYRSDQLGDPLLGPIHLEVGQISHNSEGASFEAKAPTLNNNRTGLLYRLEQFPMLGGVL